MAVMDKKKTETELTRETATIPPPAFTQTIFPIRFTAPYVSNPMTDEAKNQMRNTQLAGQTAKKGKKREAKNFDSLYQQSRHLSEDGWDGIPAEAFRSAMVSACSIVGFKMTHAKQAIQVLGDGRDSEGSGLIKILKSKPQKLESYIPNSNGSMDIRVRAKYIDVEAGLKVRWDSDMFTTSDIANLIERAGLQVGVGAGRPLSKKSGGCGWGTFELVK